MEPVPIMPDALAAEIDALVRPLPGVIPAPLEGVEARDVRNVGRRQAADRGDQELRRQRLARLGAHAPEIRRLIVVRGRHAGVEADVALQVEAVGDMVEVAQDLRRPGIALGPLPLPRQLFGERVAVGVAFRIAARAGVAVPVPGAADPSACLQHLDRKTQPVAQAEQLVEAGKPGADDQRVEVTCLLGCIPRNIRDAACRCHSDPQPIPSSSIYYRAAAGLAFRERKTCRTAVSTEASGRGVRGQAYTLYVCPSDVRTRRSSPSRIAHHRYHQLPRLCRVAVLPRKQSLPGPSIRLPFAIGIVMLLEVSIDRACAAMSSSPSVSWRYAGPRRVPGAT